MATGWQVINGFNLAPWATAEDIAYARSHQINAGQSAASQNWGADNPVSQAAAPAAVAPVIATPPSPTITNPPTTATAVRKSEDIYPTATTGLTNVTGGAGKSVGPPYAAPYTSPNVGAPYVGPISQTPAAQPTSQPIFTGKPGTAGMPGGPTPGQAVQQSTQTTQPAAAPKAAPAGGASPGKTATDLMHPLSGTEDYNGIAATQWAETFKWALSQGYYPDQITQAEAPAMARYMFGGGQDATNPLAQQEAAQATANWLYQNGYRWDEATLSWYRVAEPNPVASGNYSGGSGGSYGSGGGGYGGGGGGGGGYASNQYGFTVGLINWRI